jgi:hypothetical protein
LRQDALAPLSDWKNEVLANPSQQVWSENIPSLLRASCPIDQPEEQKRITFEALLLLTALVAQNPSGFEWIITGDES